MHYVEEGDGDPVLLLHGEPTWSFLYRKVIPELAGHRCIAPDYFGFGRSDKPVDQGFYTYDRHVESIARLASELDLRDITLVVQDWGGPIGFRFAVENPDRIARLVVLNTGIGARAPSEEWLRFREFMRRVGNEIVAGQLIRLSLVRPVDDEVIAAYDAPFPNPASKAGARAFPLILPLTPDAPGADAGQRVLEALRGDTRPKLFLWAESDPVLPLETGRRFAAALGGEIDHVIAGASHFLQEDAGPEIGRLIADWLSA